jgi:hypothetical protein
MWTRVVALAAAMPLLVGPGQQRTAPEHPAPTSPFGREIAAISEPGGYFNTDNLISNESSYLQVIPDLGRRGARGGVYIGVGPEQNFSYIAAIRPSTAYIIDIRRDNLLLHLLFKAIFQRSRTRVDYLAQLFGRAMPRDAGDWPTADVARLAHYIDQAPRADTTTLQAALDQTIRGFGTGLSNADLQTIRGFHRRFIDAGLSLQFESTGRPPQGYYPDYRALLLDTDPTGAHTNFLGSEAGFQFVKDLEGRDRVIPVVGDLAGPGALKAIAATLTGRGERVSAFYASNVEFYLFREGGFGKFAANLRQLPHSANSVVIRSVFGRFSGGLRPSDDSTSRLQSIDDLLSRWSAGRIVAYRDLIDTP